MPDRFTSSREKLSIAAFAGLGMMYGGALPWLHPQALTIDHIMPISAGGSDAESNLWPCASSL